MKKNITTLLVSVLLAGVAYMDWPYVYQVSMIWILKKGVDVSTSDYVAPIVERVIFTSGWFLLPWLVKIIAHKVSLKTKEQKLTLVLIVIGTGILTYALKVYFKQSEFQKPEALFYNPLTIDFPHFSYFLLLGFLIGALLGWFTFRLQKRGNAEFNT